MRHNSRNEYSHRTTSALVLVHYDQTIIDKNITSIGNALLTNKVAFS